MAQMNIKQVRGASQGSILFLGTNSVVSEDINKLSWDESNNVFNLVGNLKINDGNQVSGYVLTTDATGLATWSQSLAPTQSLVEIPISGTQNGNNRDFTLAYQLLYPQHLLFLNGQLLQSSIDYTISGTAISIDVDRPAPSDTDYLRIFGAATGIGGSIQEINGLTSLIQSFTTSTDGNLIFDVYSTIDTHNFNVQLNDVISGNKTFSNDVYVNGNLEVGTNSYFSGDLLPNVDDVYSLGSPTYQWKKLYVGSQSLYIGGVTISSTGEAISINQINLGTENNSVLLSASGSNIYLNENILVSATDAKTLVVAKDGGEYTSIKTAVESITDASATNVYTVKVRSGIYYEEPFTIPSYVAIKGDTSISTIIEATFSSQTLITLSDQSAVFDVQIQGCTDTGVAAVVYSSPTTPQTNAIAYVENVRFGENYTHAKVVGTGSGNCIMQCSNIKYGGYPFTVGFQATNSGSGVGRMQLRNVTSTNGGITTTSGLIFAKADAAGCGFIVNGCLLTKSVGSPVGIGFQVENGGFLRLTGVNFQRWSKAIYAPDDLGTPSIDAIALNFENNTIDVQIDNTKTIGKIQGVDNYSKTLISSTSSLYVVNKDQRIITVSKKGGDFSSISAAVNSITDSSDINRYTVEVGPGVFTENLIDLSSKPYVSIVGSNIQTTQIFASGSNHHLIKMGVFNEVSFLSLNEVGIGYSAILAEDSGDFSQLHKVSFYNCDTGIKINTTSQETIFYGEYVDFNGTYSKAVDIQSTNGNRAFANIENFYCFPGVTGSYATYVTGTSSELNVSVATFEGLGDDYAFYLENGGKLNVTSADVIGFETGLWVPNVGTASFFDFGNVTFADDVVTTINIQQPNTRGFFQGSLYDHTTIQSNSQDIYWQFLDRIDGELNITRKLSITYGDLTTTDASTLLFETAPMGVISGGVISELIGTTISVSSGYGYLEVTTGEVHKRIDWNTSTLFLPSSSSEYIFINENSILTHDTTLPNSDNNIILGRVATFNGSIVFIDNTRFDTKHAANKLNLFNRKALGSVYESGSLVIEGTPNFSLNVTGGSYWYGDRNFQPSGGTSITFYQVYRDGLGSWVISGTNSVTSKYDNNSGSLITMSASYFTKHTLYVVGQGVDEKYLLLIGQSQYLNLVDAEDAPLPTPPTYFEDGVTSISSIYVQQGATGILQVEDIRPVIGFKSSGVNASADHGNLLGLSDDDHPQYLLVGGSRSMVGNLQMGSNSITGVLQVNGVTVENHASRHLPNGSDPLATGVPSNVGISNQEGVQNAFARQDHIHALGADVVSDSNILAHTSSKITIVNKSQLNSTIVYTDQSNTFGSFSNVFRSSNLSLANPTNTSNYTFVGSAITSNRNAILPLLTGNDTFVFENHTQTLTNKTLTSPVITNSTMSNTFVSGVATFSSGVFMDNLPTDVQSKKLSLNSSNEIIEINPYQKVDLFMNNNTSATITATNSWLRVTGNADISALTSNSFTYSNDPVVLISATGDGGFENTITTGTQGFADNGWILVNGSETNRWFVSATGASGSGFGAYISSNGGTTNIYNTGVSSAAYFYRDINFPPFTSNININLSVRVTGEGNFDRLRVYLLPTSFTPVAGADYTNQIAQYSLLTGYQNQTISTSISPSSATQSRRLVIGWRNDGSAGVNPPASVDRISVSIPPPIVLNYTGNLATFKSIWTGSFQSTSAISSVGLQISKNDVTSNNLSESSFNLAVNTKTSFSIQNTFTMSGGDTINPLLNNKVSNASVLVNDMVFNLIQID